MEVDPIDYDYTDRDSFLLPLKVIPRPKLDDTSCLFNQASSIEYTR